MNTNTTIIRFHHHQFVAIEHGLNNNAEIASVSCWMLNPIEIESAKLVVCNYPTTMCGSNTTIHYCCWCYWLLPLFIRPFVIVVIRNIEFELYVSSVCFFFFIFGLIERYSVLESVARLILISVQFSAGFKVICSDTNYSKNCRSNLRNKFAWEQKQNRREEKKTHIWNATQRRRMPHNGSTHTRRTQSTKAKNTLKVRMLPFSGISM